jgi:hypothetical protein
MAVALLALVVALGTSGAVAATLITGKQVKNRSLTGADLKKNTLGGTEVNEAKLAKVPAAARADAATRADSAARADAATRADSALRADTASSADQLGGLGADGFLRSDRVLSASVPNASGSVGTVLFRDPATGLEVRAGDQGRPRLLNTNEGVELFVRGVGWFVVGNLSGYSATILPGNFAQVTFDATGFSYAQLIVVKRVADGSPAPRLQLTCTFNDSSIPVQNVLSCVGVR